MPEEKKSKMTDQEQVAVILLSKMDQWRAWIKEIFDLHPLEEIFDLHDILSEEYIDYEKQFKISKHDEDYKGFIKSGFALFGIFVMLEEMFEKGELDLTEEIEEEEEEYEIDEEETEEDDQSS